ncbi:MAG: hypothetical protein KA270_19410 [Saprospiraceae bacterium]|nr:hypothetical protein [Saprospiraceae bacterium]
MRKFSLLLKAFSISLVIVLLTNSIGYANEASNLYAATPKCGEWKFDSYSPANDQRIGIELLRQAVENDCSAQFTLSNQTFGGGYSLELKTITKNANTELLTNMGPYLVPGLNFEVQVVPIDRFQSAKVSVQGNITLASYLTVDLSFFLLRAGLAFAENKGCLISPEQGLLVALRAGPILGKTVRLAREGDLMGAKDELSKATFVFYEKAYDVLKDVGVDCSLTFSILSANKYFITAQITVAFLTWWPVVMFDYFKYIKLPASANLVYVPPAVSDIPPLEGWIAFGDKYNIWLIHPDGSGVTQITNIAPLQNSEWNVVNEAKWSPDGTKLAYSQLVYRADDYSSSKYTIFLYDVQTSATTTLLEDTGGDFNWSHTGEQIIYNTANFTASCNGCSMSGTELKNNGVWVINVENRAANMVYDGFSVQWSSDMTHVLRYPDMGYSVYVIDLSDNSYRETIIDERVYDCEWAPNELIIACWRGVSGEDNRAHGVVTLFDVNGNIILNIPLSDKMDLGSVDWSPDGKNLALGYFYSENNNFISETVILSLETQEFKSFVGRAKSDWSPDGQWIVTWGRVSDLQTVISVVNTISGKSFPLGEGEWAAWQP